MKIKRFYCSFEGCNKSFRSQDQLTTHSLSHIISESEPEENLMFECDICTMKYATKRSVSAHRRIHQNSPKSFYSEKIINFLTSRLSDSDFLAYEIPTSPHTLDDIHLPQVTEPKSAELPQFLITFGYNST